MLVLFETAAGYALFKVLEESKFSIHEDLLADHEESHESISSLVKLKNFVHFDDTATALLASNSTLEGKIAKPLKKLLKKLVATDLHEDLLVSDAKLGQAIKEKYDISCISTGPVQKLMRLIRSQMESLIEIPEKEVAAMRIGLAHSLSRYKLKFSPDKVDTMIVQAISLLDDLDKEVNNYIMRCREWYGWHFPELAKIIEDNLLYCKVVKLIGMRTEAAHCDLQTLVDSEMTQQIIDAAETSIGTEISEEDILNIRHLADQVQQISDYRSKLNEYLKNRMNAIAPNLTVLVGESVGARLIARAGSLVNLAKHPASTVQILGAEKALFRAIKARHDTPKYGLIYHASLIGKCGPRLKGKLSRMLAAKSALAARVDALGDGSDLEIGVKHRATLEDRLCKLEQYAIRQISGTGKRLASQGPSGDTSGSHNVEQYDEEMDFTMDYKKPKIN